MIKQYTYVIIHSHRKPSDKTYSDQEPRKQDVCDVCYAMRVGVVVVEGGVGWLDVWEVVVVAVDGVVPSWSRVAVDVVAEVLSLWSLWTWKTMWKVVVVAGCCPIWLNAMQCHAKLCNVVEAVVTWVRGCGGGRVGVGKGCGKVVVVKTW